MASVLRGIARRVGFARSASVFAALLAGTLTQVAMQVGTDAERPARATFVAAAACLPIMLERTRSGAVLAGLAVALAIGRKMTSGFALPLLLAARRPHRCRAAGRGASPRAAARSSSSAYYG